MKVYNTYALFLFESLESGATEIIKPKHTVITRDGDAVIGHKV